MKMLILLQKPHSFVDLITNSSTELFCEITSEKYFPIIREELERIFQHKVRVSNYEDGLQVIQFEIEYGDNEEICDDFCALLENYLTNLVGQGNFKINRDASY